jgi:glycosyltransferase involved in cell wall biosynthesis
MTIGFDAKRAFHNKSGLGNYSRDTILSLENYFPNESYIYFNPKPSQLFQPNTGSIIMPQSFLDQKLSSRWRTYGLRKYFEPLKLDVYHGLSNELPFGKKTFSTKEIVTIHDLIFMHYPETYKVIDRKIYVRKFSAACKNADIVVATSTSTKKDIMHFFGTEDNKIKVVYQSCNDLFLNATNLQGAIDNTSFNLPQQYLLSVGTIEERKNQLLILEAIKNTDLHLVLVGKQKMYAAKLKGYIAAHKMEDRVHFIEQADNHALLTIYQKASALIYASLYEGFGIPLLEAMALGIPVISSNASSLSEVGGEAALYFDPKSVSQLEEQIQKLMNNHELKNTLILKGKAQVQKFSKAQMAKDLMAIYKA